LTANPAVRRVGVIGTGAMGGGVVQSLVRAGIATIARDIRPEAQDAAVRHGAMAAASAAALARDCDAVIVLVGNAAEVEAVLFGADGALASLAPDAVILVSSTVDPAYSAALAPRLAECGVALLDAPVSGGPAKAAAGTMTMMVSGDPAAFDRVRTLLDAITGRLFALGPRAGDASAFKIVNNLLAAANLAAGAEALALARAAGLDLQRVLDVIGASSGASWILTDRGPRALAADHAPRAAARILAKDIGIAVALAERLGVDATFARTAQSAFAAALTAGFAEDDDAVLVACALERASTRKAAG
jgi:3-hydroxyisobutyrate dehydrogenase-like beta-hydroxyacid dehydrogenase